jgi:hypothetical protein
VFQINGIQLDLTKLVNTRSRVLKAEKIIPAVVVVNGEIKDIGDITHYNRSII